jgi:hypothetical protein
VAQVPSSPLKSARVSQVPAGRSRNSAGAGGERVGAQQGRRTTCEHARSVGHGGIGYLQAIPGSTGEECWSGHGGSAFVRTAGADAVHGLCVEGTLVSTGSCLRQPGSSW